MGEVHDAPDPAPLLVDYVGRLPHGRALDVAMGYGRNALFLAASGWDVHGIERDPVAVAACRREAARRGLTLTAEEADLDSYRIPVGRYDVIVVFYFLDRLLLPQIREGLRPGGAIVYETFSIENRNRFGRPGRAEFCFQPGELTAVFSDFTILHHREGLVGGQYVAQLVAVKRAAGGS